MLPQLFRVLPNFHSKRSDPLKERKCNNTKCLICSTGGKGSCRSTGVTYELVCQICRHKYIGETFRSAYTRGKERLKALEQREEGSIWWRHCCDVHAGNIVGSITSRCSGKEPALFPRTRHERATEIEPSNIVGFTMNVTGTFQNDAVSRLITESVKINETKEGQLVNPKEEYPKSGCHAIVKYFFVFLLHNRN